MSYAAQIEVSVGERAAARGSSDAEGAVDAVSPQKLPTFKVAKQTAISAFERQYFADVLVASGGSITIASKITGVDRANLRRLLIRNGLRPPGERTVKKAGSRPRRRKVKLEVRAATEST